MATTAALLPTADYTAFTSLFLPAGALRTVDGRLREILALPECGGACIPDQRWLDLMGVRYLITDKVYDLVNDGVFYDTTFTRGGSATYANPQAFVSTAVDVLCNPCDDLRVLAADADLAAGESVSVGDYSPHPLRRRSAERAGHRDHRDRWISTGSDVGRYPHGRFSAARARSLDARPVERHQNVRQWIGFAARFRRRRCCVGQRRRSRHRGRAQADARPGVRSSADGGYFE